MENFIKHQPPISEQCIISKEQQTVELVHVSFIFIHVINDDDFL